MPASRTSVTFLVESAWQSDMTFETSMSCQPSTDAMIELAPEAEPLAEPEAEPEVSVLEAAVWVSVEAEPLSLAPAVVVVSLEPLVEAVVSSDEPLVEAVVSADGVVVEPLALPLASALVDVSADGVVVAEPLVSALAEVSAEGVVVAEPLALPLVSVLAAAVSVVADPEAAPI
jgi:hypothetical protein